MSRTLFVLALSLLSIDFLTAQEKETKDIPDKKPKAQVDGVKKETPDAPVKNPKAQPDGVKKEAKPDGIQKENSDAPVKNPKGQSDGVKKEKPDAVKKEAKPDGDKSKGNGRVSKVGVEGATIKLSVDGKDYAFVVSDATRAMLKTKEADGKEVVLSLQLYNASEGDKKDFVKKEGVKKGDENPDGAKKKIEVKSDEKPNEKKPD